MDPSYGAVVDYDYPELQLKSPKGSYFVYLEK